MLNQKTCIRFKLVDNKPSIFDSKVGGLGYLPHDMQVPCDSDRNQLRLLAQIDCSQVDFAPFPKSGLLQFWIQNSEDYGGWDTTEQDTFRVIYYPEVDRTVTETENQNKFVPYTEDDEECTPVMGEYGMEFFKSESRFFDWDEEPDEEDSSDENDNYHQIGGYPFFTQGDPRLEDSPYDFVLFQLDSDYCDDTEKVMWGDSGIGNFFINSEKLKQLDFSDVLYNWDCC